MSKHTEQEEDEGNQSALVFFILFCVYIIIVSTLCTVLPQ